MVRLPPHPPSWHIYHRQHAWIPPFAFNGAAARHPSVVASAGGHREHRWALAGSGGFSLAHVSIVLLSFCPVLAYLLVTAAFQRRTALYTPINSSMESCARDARKPASKEVPEFTGPTPTVAGRTPTPVRGWWAKHWSALLEDDNVQVAISSLSAAAASNVFYAPGTARVSRCCVAHILRVFRPLPPVPFSLFRRKILSWCTGVFVVEPERASSGDDLSDHVTAATNPLHVCPLHVCTVDNAGPWHEHLTPNVIHLECAF